MHVRIWLVSAAALIALLATLGAAAQPPGETAEQKTGAPASKADGVRALDGEWIYVEDRTEAQPLERLGPPMASKFSMGVEEGAVILNGHG